MRRTRFLFAAALGVSVFSICGRASAQAPAGQPPVLPETEVVAQPTTVPTSPATGAGQTSILDGSVFASPRTEGYRANSSTTGTWLDVPDIQYPGSVNVVPQDVIRDQQNLRFQDIYRNIPGAVQGGDGNFADRFFMRGYEVQSTDFRKNGMLDPTYTPRDFANVERVEVLKGPAGFIYGPGSPAGVVNLITKKPLDDQFAFGSITIGSFDQMRYTFDVNGYANESGSLLYRVNAAYENSNSFRDFGYLERAFVAPALTWVVDSDTSLTFEAEFHNDRRQGDSGLPNQGTNPLAYPISRYVGIPALDKYYSEDLRASLFLNHRFNDQWSMQVAGTTLYFEFPQATTFGAFPGVIAGGGPSDIVRLHSDLRDREKTQSLVANLAGDGDVLGFRHRVIIGTEHVNYESASSVVVSQVGDTGGPFGGLFDVNNPNYNTPPLFPVSSTNIPVFRQVRHGYYAQDMVNLTDNLIAIGGVRIDDVDFAQEINGVRDEQRFLRGTPRAGILWQAIPDELAFFYNYARSFAPPPGGGNLPSFGEMHEAGIKMQLLENLAFNVTGFHNDQQNKPFRSGGGLLVDYGNAEAKGMEMSLAGQFTDRFSTIANYAYTDTEIQSADGTFFGQHERNVPYNSANLWSRYDLIQNPEQTFGAALGVVYVGDRAANLADSFELAEYARLDAGFYWRQGRMNTMLYIENIFDRRYATGSIDAFPVPGALTNVYPGAPTNARLQVSFVY